MNNKILLMYIGLVVLFLTTFPLCLGYLPFGMFRPRVLLLLCTFVLASHIWGSDIFRKFMLFAIYALIARFVGGVFTIDGYGANFMEYALPILMFLTAISINDLRIYRVIVVFAVSTTLATMLLSINASMIYPDAIRGLVGATAIGDSAMAILYQRAGVCSYGFAAMMMVVAPICMNLSKNYKGRKRYILYAITALGLYFLYVAGTTTPFLISLLMTAFAFLVKDLSFKRILITSAFIAIVVPVVLQFMSQMAIFEGTNFEDRIADVSSVSAGREADENGDLATRNELITKSISAIFESPLFGSFTSTKGGHNYFLDLFALYGIFGMILYIAFFIKLVKKTISMISARYQSVYIICVASLLLLGILKWCSGIDYWLYTFFYIPCFLIYLSRKEAEGK